jgi:hypothetical protein
MRMQITMGCVLVLAVLAVAPILSGEPLRPDRSAAEHAVFLLDTSQSRHPEKYAADLQQMEKVLAPEPGIKRFNVVTFDLSARWLEPKKWIDNSADARREALKRLDGIVLEGATDVAAVLETLARPDFKIASETPVAVYLLSDGVITWGEADVATLLARFTARCPFRPKFKCYASEKGEENLPLFRALETLSVKGTQEQGTGTSAQKAFARFLAEVEPQLKLKGNASADDLQTLLNILAEADFELPVVEAGAAPPLTTDVPQAYLKDRDADRKRIPVYLKEAERRTAAGNVAGAVRVLSSVVEEHPTNPEALRLVGYRLLDLKRPGQAARLFTQVRRQRPFEAHSYRDLARSLEDAGKFGLAALQYEIVQAGTFQGQFTQSLKDVVLEEYAHMMRDAIHRKAIANKLLNQFGERLERVATDKLQADLRVTISWNTDNTDVDLWVIEPDGTKCFYGHQKTKNGGELTQDVTWGYGPERYQMIKAGPGEYAVKVHYYSGPRNALVGETHVNVVVRRNAGTPQEVSQRYTVILRQRNDLIEVCRMKF